MAFPGNETHSCTVMCPILTEKVHDLDNDLFYCKYHEWAYAIVAFLFTVVTILFLGCILRCASSRRKRKKRARAQISRQVSVASSDNQSKLDWSQDSEYERLSSSSSHKREAACGNRIGQYGTFCSSLPDHLEEGLVHGKFHGDPSMQPSYSTNDIRPYGAAETRGGLPFNYSHFADKDTNKRRSPRYSEPNGQSYTRPRLYPDITRSLESLSHSIGSQDNLVRTAAEGSSTIAVNSNDQGLGNSVDRGTHNIGDSAQDNLAIYYPVDSQSNDSLIGSRAHFWTGEKSVADEEELSTSPYVYKLPTRKDFEDFLLSHVFKLPEDQRNGTFLIRESLSSYGNKVLMLYCRSAEVHRNTFYFKICHTASGRVFIEGPTNDSFESLQELISFHRQYRSYLPCLLGDCLGTSFTFQPSLKPAMADVPT